MSKTKKITLYKYLPFTFDKNGLNHSLNLILNNEIYFAKQSDLNDPFELLDEEGNIINEVRVASLTNSYRKKLMWSHYANGHRGICIAAEVPENDIYPIIYSSRNKHFNLEELKNSTTKKLKVEFKPLNGKEKYAVYKDKKWSYEKEYRIILNTDNNSFLPDTIAFKGDNFFYKTFRIKRVYLGVNFDFAQDCSKQLLKFLKINKIETKIMKISKKDYSIYPDKYIF